MIRLFRNLFRPRNKPVFEWPAPSVSERGEIEKSYVRLFAGADGKKVLAHLQSLTFARAYGPEASGEQIRYSEGQRALVATILRLAYSGRQS